MNSFASAGGDEYILIFCTTISYIYGWPNTDEQQNMFSTSLLIIFESFFLQQKMAPAITIDAEAITASKKIVI
jgi:hypothetical protein